MLIDTTAQQYNESFDPELHIWEIREIEAAIDIGFIRSLLADLSNFDNYYEDVQRRSQVLEGFVNSPAF